jgi:hypothetical protein
MNNQNAFGVILFGDPLRYVLPPFDIKTNLTDFLILLILISDAFLTPRVESD